MAAFQFEVVTPERTVVHQDVEYVSLRNGRPVWGAG